MLNAALFFACFTAGFLLASGNVTFRASLGGDAGNGARRRGVSP